MRANTRLHARKSRYTVRIFPPTYFTIRVFSTLRLHFHSGTRGVNNRRRQARVDRSIVGRVLYIYTRITWGMLFAILEIHSVRAENHRTISIRNNKMNTRKRLCRSMNFFLTSYRIDLSINSSSAHHSFVPRINAARSISTDKPLYIVPYPWSVTVFISSPSQTLNPPLEPR